MVKFIEIWLCIALFLLFIATSALASVINLDEEMPLVHSVVLDADENYRLFWNFDDEKIVMEARVETTGYIGLGLSPNGGMSGSDVIIAGVDDVTNKPYLSDRHALGNTEPVEDEHANWHLISARQNETHTVVRVWRKLDTCDEQDRAIKLETVRVIWTYHAEDWDTAKRRYHGEKYRGAKSVFLLNPQKVVPDIPDDSLTTDFLNSKVSVPTASTTYWCEAFSMPTLQQQHHVIKFEPIIQPGNEGIVHHIVLYSCAHQTSNETAGITGACFETAMPEAWKSCYTTIFAWAVGGGAFYLPDHVGYPFGLEDEPKLLLLQTHFDNPTERADFVDSSGIRLTLTHRLRKYDAGTLAVGANVWKTMFIPPHAPTYRVDGHCMPECLSEMGMGGKTSINVFATFLHAHLLSTALKFRHFRDGIEQRPISEDDNYDFNFQETRLLEEEVTIKRGDHLVFECYYQSMDRDKVTFGGESTRDEMCEAYAMYYPRIPLSNCYSRVDNNLMAKIANVSVYDSSRYNLTVNEPAHLRGKSIDDVMTNHMQWTEEITALAQEETTSYKNGLYLTCFRDLVNLFPRNNETVTPPAIKQTWKTNRKCSNPVRDSPPDNGSVRKSPCRESLFVTAILLFSYLSLQ